MPKVNPEWDYEATYSSNIKIKELTEEIARLEKMLYNACESRGDGDSLDGDTYDWYIEQINLKARNVK